MSDRPSPQLFTGMNLWPFKKETKETFEAVACAACPYRRQGQSDATWTNTIGAAELITVWEDSDFNPDQKAFLLRRVGSIRLFQWLFDGVSASMRTPLMMDTPGNKVRELAATHRGWQWVDDSNRSLWTRDRDQACDDIVLGRIGDALLPLRTYPTITT